MAMLESMKEIPAGKFKDKCLAILDQVAETREPVVVTKRGHPVAQIVPCTVSVESLGLGDSLLEERGDPYGTGEVWAADVP